MLRLVADVGGTRARFALAEPDGRLSAQVEFDAAAYETPIAAARAYFASATSGGSPGKLSSQWQRRPRQAR